MIVGSMMLSNIGNLDTANQVQMELMVKSNATCEFVKKDGEITCTRFCPLITQLIELALYICTRNSGPYGPLKILAPAESLLASLTNMFASLTKVFALLTRNFA